MISHKYKFIFVHISRTGGTSIEDVFSKDEVPPGEKHKTAVAIRTIVGESVWENYFKFTFVRNPYDRMISYYLWRKSKHWGWDAKNKTFKEWLEFIETYRQSKVGPIKTPVFHLAIQQQFDQISDGEKVILDFVGRFESIQNDFDKICGILHVTYKELAHINMLERNHYSKYYDRKTRLLVQKLYKKDIDHFNYKFEKK